MAYQIAFDMYESAPQQFLWRVIEALRVTAPVPSAAHNTATTPEDEKRVENLVRRIIWVKIGNP